MAISSGSMTKENYIISLSLCPYSWFLTIFNSFCLFSYAYSYIPAFVLHFWLILWFKISIIHDHHILIRLTWTSQWFRMVLKTAKFIGYSTLHSWHPYIFINGTIFGATQSLIFGLLSGFFDPNWVIKWTAGLVKGHYFHSLWGILKMHFSQRCWPSIWDKAIMT